MSTKKNCNYRCSPSMVPLPFSMFLNILGFALSVAIVVSIQALSMGLEPASPSCRCCSPSRSLGDICDMRAISCNICGSDAACSKG